MKVRKFNTYSSELECSTETGAEFSLPQKVTVVLAEDYEKLYAKSRWQPIATAPRDGTDIIVGFDFATVWIVHVAWYRDGGIECGVTGPQDIGWWSYVRNSVSQEKLEGHYEPTHWMPLSELPAGKDCE